MRALLLSNSTNPAMDPLSHARAAITYLLRGVDTLVFVPYALADWDGYTERTREALSGACHVVGAHRLAGDEFQQAGAYFVGGGNTFRLLRKLQQDGLLEIIGRRVGKGAAYLGTSAGSAIAGPSLRTTNDMPIVEPASFAALGLVGFHLNCHYVDPPTGPRTYMGETRDERLEEFLEENDTEVVCLREGAWIAVDGSHVTIGGRNGGKYFRRGRPPQQLVTGDTGVDTTTWSNE